MSVLTLLVIGLSFSVGQESPSKCAIHGKVTDLSGAVVHDAKAVLTNAIAAGVRLAIDVDDNGSYSVSNLFPGTYTLTISAENFDDVVFENVRLTPEKELTLDATLKPATIKPAPVAEQAEQSAAPAATTHKIEGDKGTVTGTVTDQTGAVVTSAKAVLTNGAGQKLEVQVGDRGNYIFNELSPGTYTLAVTAPNFAAKTLDNITVTAGLKLALDASLEPAGAGNTVVK